jgi:hypothetical protein
VELHIFAHASESAFGAITYLRFIQPEEIQIAFVMAKTRVAPIPRLKICAAHLAARLSSVISKEIRFKIDQTIYWSDSTTVLRWIYSPHYRFHVYVGNRIGEILELSDSNQWRYVRTTQNPADDVSRAVLATEFSTEHRFYTGPPFLYESPENWPIFDQECLIFDQECRIGTVPANPARRLRPARVQRNGTRAGRNSDQVVTLTKQSLF